MEHKREYGTILWINYNRYYGYIEDENENPIFFHGTALPMPITAYAPKEKVSFVRFKTPRGDNAAYIEKV
jgi:cold shock CspA family protein